MAKKMAKKSQMEIMGLTIVIILMILGMLFVVRFVVLKPKSDIKQSYADTVLAANMKNSLLLFTTGCHGQKIQDLLADCVSSSTPAITCPNGQNSCGYALQQIKAIFAQTLDKWNREYYFEACLWEGRECKTSLTSPSSLNSPPWLIITPPKKNDPSQRMEWQSVCKQEVESKFSPVQTQANRIMMVTLKICRNVG